MTSSGMVFTEITNQPQTHMLFFFAGVFGLTAGSLFLMWLGEQIDKYGIGNGVSLILTAGIIAQMDEAVLWVVNNFSLSSRAPRKRRSARPRCSSSSRRSSSWSPERS